MIVALAACWSAKMGYGNIIILIRIRGQFPATHSDFQLSLSVTSTASPSLKLKGDALASAWTWIGTS